MERKRSEKREISNPAFISQPDRTIKASTSHNSIWESFKHILKHCANHSLIIIVLVIFSLSYGDVTSVFSFLSIVFGIKTVLNLINKRQPVGKTTKTTFREGIIGVAAMFILTLVFYLLQLYKIIKCKVSGGKVIKTLLTIFTILSISVVTLLLNTKPEPTYFIEIFSDTIGNMQKKVSYSDLPSLKNNIGILVWIILTAAYAVAASRMLLYSDCSRDNKLKSDKKEK